MVELRRDRVQAPRQLAQLMLDARDSLFYFQRLRDVLVRRRWGLSGSERTPCIHAMTVFV
jgi:hypothetical protein